MRHATPQSVSWRRFARAATAAVLGSLAGMLCPALTDSSGVAVATDAPLAWRLSVLGAGGDYSSLALDSGGDDHACWLNRGTRRYATNATGTWVTRTLDTPGEGFGLTYSSAIALDRADAVHIAYDGTESLRYATNASGTWVFTTVDDPGYDVGDDVAMAVDSKTKVHISYLDRESGRLRYATDVSGSWVVYDLGPGGYNTAIAVDSNDKLHIVHDRFTPASQVAYTTNAPGGWVTVPVGGTMGYYNSVKVDAAGAAHISYFDGSVRYVTNASGSWVTTLVDGAPGVAANSSLVLDSAGKAHVTYGDYDAGSLKYATNASGAWVLSVLAAGEDVGYSSSLAIDGADMLHVTYTDRSTSKVNYATTRVVVTCKSVAPQDGSVRESSKGSGRGGARDTASKTLLVGDDKSDRQQRTILTFDTSKLPDGAVVVAARLKLLRKSVSGTNPCTTHGTLSVDVGSPGFGSSLALKASDFEAAAGAAGAGIVDPTAHAGFFVSQLGAAALDRIDRTGRTQLRLAFASATNADGNADCLVFHSGNATRPSLRPVLVVAYRVP